MYIHARAMSSHCTTGFGWHNVALSISQLQQLMRTSCASASSTCRTRPVRLLTVSTSRLTAYTFQLHSAPSQPMVKVDRNEVLWPTYDYLWLFCVRIAQILVGMLSEAHQGVTESYFTIVCFSEPVLRRIRAQKHFHCCWDRIIATKVSCMLWIKIFLNFLLYIFLQYVKK